MPHRRAYTADFGFLICTSLLTKPMRDEIAAAGKFKHPLLNHEDDRLQVITVAELFAPHNVRLDLAMARSDAVKTAAALGDRAATLLAMTVSADVIRLWHNRPGATETAFLQTSLCGTSASASQPTLFHPVDPYTASLRVQRSNPALQSMDRPARRAMRIV